MVYSKEERKVYNIKHRVEHPEYFINYYKTPAGKATVLKAQIKYRKTPSGKANRLKDQAKYQKTPAGKLTKIKNQSKRDRNLGFDPIGEQLNEPSNWHHLNKTCVISIPITLHKKVFHNHEDPVSMEKINTLVYLWILIGDGDLCRFRQSR